MKVRNDEMTEIAPIEEREVIFNYDELEDTWYYYSNIPKLNRKWESLVKAERKEYNDRGRIVLLEGTILGSVNINRPRKMTREQKVRASERMKELRQFQMNSVVSE